MTEQEALAGIKIECKLLAEVFTDTELIYFLNKYKTTNIDLNLNSVTTYNIRKSIYDALTSILSTEAQYESRGDISMNRVDLIKVRNMFAQVSVIKVYRND